VAAESETRVRLLRRLDLCALLRGGSRRFQRDVRSIAEDSILEITHARRVGGKGFRHSPAGRIRGQRNNQQHPARRSLQNRQRESAATLKLKENRNYNQMFGLSAKPSARRAFYYAGEAKVSMVGPMHGTGIQSVSAF